MATQTPPNTPTGAYRGIGYDPASGTTVTDPSGTSYSWLTSGDAYRQALAAGQQVYYEPQPGVFKQVGANAQDFVTAGTAAFQTAAYVQNGMNPNQQSAWALLTQTLQSYGFTGADLTALTQFVQHELTNGVNADQISLDLQNTQEFARRFPAIVQRRQAGLPPISPAEYVSLERQYQQLERSAGLPHGFTDKAHYDTLIANDVSASEYSERINNGYVAMLQSPAEARQALKDYYGVTDGHMAAYFLDPTKALPLLKQQAQAAIIGGAGIRSGFGEVSQGQALRLAQLGVNPEQAQTGFMDLYHQRQLAGSLPGQSQLPISTEGLLGAEFGGDEATREALQRRADQEKAYFQQGGGYAQTQAGLSGLGQVVR